MNNICPEEIPVSGDRYLHFEIEGYCEDDLQIANTLRDIANRIDDGTLKAKSKSVKVEKHNSEKIILDSIKKNIVYYFVLENNPKLNLIFD